MKWLLSIIFITYTPTAMAGDQLASKPKVKWPDCYCTDKTGARVELGTMVCMKVGGRDFIARCEMSLNNPMWREISQGCMSSSNQTLDSSTHSPTHHLLMPKSE